MATLQVKKSTKLATLTMEGPWPTAIAFLEKDKLVVGNRGGQMFLWNLPEKPTTEETAPSR